MRRAGTEPRQLMLRCEPSRQVALRVLGPRWEGLLGVTYRHNRALFGARAAGAKSAISFTRAFRLRIKQPQEAVPI